MVTDENRPHVVPRGVEPLAGAIAALLANPARAAEIGAANARRARAAFAQQRMFDVYEGLFDGGVVRR
jgi:glycosyltransferase involved in cell wall biosynthesis